MKDLRWITLWPVLAALLVVPLLLFPHGVWPFLALGVGLLLVAWRWYALGRPALTRLDVPLFFLLCMALVGLAISVDRAIELAALLEPGAGVAGFLCNPLDC